MRPYEQGFSLLEVLVAFAILALSLGVLLQIFAGGARSAWTAEAYARAADVAESVMALAGTELPLAVGVHQGETHGYRWTLEMLPYPTTELLAPPGHLALLQLVVRVQWIEGEATRKLTLDSLRVVQAGQ
jgi:general secretion pathway protein I